MSKDKLGQNGIGYALYNMVAIISLLMITDTFAVYGPEDTSIMACQMVKYVPQAIFMVAAPMLCYATYHEIIPKKWKIIKFLLIGVLFTISLIITVKFGLSILEGEHDSVEIKLMLLPMTFYTQLTVGILNQYDVFRWERMNID